MRRSPNWLPPSRRPKKPGLLHRRRRDQLGPGASQLLRELVDATGFPITSTLMGLGAYPASGKNWMGMLGMHGLYEANMAMHDCDLMINIGARFDDRITGRIDAFSPTRKSAYRYRPVVDQQGDPRRYPDRRRRGPCAGRHLKVWKSRGRKTNQRRWSSGKPDRGLAQGRTACLHPERRKDHQAAARACNGLRN